MLLLRNEGNLWYTVPCCCFPVDRCCHFLMGSEQSLDGPLRTHFGTSSKWKETFGTREGFETCPNRCCPHLSFSSNGKTSSASQSGVMWA